MLRIVVVIAMVGALMSTVGLLGFLPVAAQGSDPSATRSFDTRQQWSRTVRWW